MSVGGDGVHGASNEGNGVSGVGAENGVVGTTTSPGRVVVIGGVNGSSGGDGAGVLGQSTGDGPGVLAIARDHTEDVLGVLEYPGLGAFVAGDLVVTGDICLANSDGAEDFDVADASVVPGSVVVLDSEGRVEVCRREHDKRVVGVISGAGDFRPGITLGRQGQGLSRLPVALFGKVYCKADASRAPIRVGDTLTTSSTPGHAMKADDRAKAFGAAIGKSLGQLKTCVGLVPMLVVSNDRQAGSGLMR